MEGWDKPRVETPLAGYRGLQGTETHCNIVCHLMGNTKPPVLYTVKLCDLKDLSHEMDLAFDDMLGPFKA
jgi:hypothetical protein